MKNVIEVRVASIDIPSLGMCTLLPCNNELIPPRMRTYVEIEGFASTILLAPLPELTHSQFQEIFRSLSIFFSEGEVLAGAELGVILSGTHHSFVSIDTDSEAQDTEDCVTLLDFSSWNRKGKEITNRPFANYFEMVRDEVPAGENFDVTNRNILYCLFLGAHESAP